MNDEINLYIEYVSFVADDIFRKEKAKEISDSDGIRSFRSSKIICGKTRVRTIRKRICNNVDIICFVARLYASLLDSERYLL